MVTPAGKGGKPEYLGKQRQLLYAMPVCHLVVRDRSRVLELSADHQSTAYKRIDVLAAELAAAASSNMHLPGVQTFATSIS